MHINDYARGFKTGGRNYDVTMYAKSINQGVPQKEPPMGPGPKYSPTAVSMPAYKGRPKQGKRGSYGSKMDY